MAIVAETNKDILVNSTVKGRQTEPWITKLADGGWVIAWASAKEGSSDTDIYQQAYNANGSKRGNEIKVHTDSKKAQNTYKITALPDGGWVTVWQSDKQDGSGLGIYQQVFKANGQKKGGETQVNTTTAGHQDAADITVLKNGGWVVTWESENKDGSGFAISQQVYRPNGTPKGGEIQVNSYTSDSQWRPLVAPLKDGGWVVVWISNGQDGSDRGIFQQAYNADGTTQGAETQVNTSTFAQQERQLVLALDNGGWVVVWTDRGGADGGAVNPGGDGWGVFQQVFRANGTKKGGETQINPKGIGQQGVRTDIALLKDGGWVVLFDDSAANNGGIVQQVFNADGSKQGSAINVNTYKKSFQISPKVAALKDGGWVVTWVSDNQDGADGGVYQQAYNPNGTTRGDEIRVHKYTNSDQTSQRIIALDDGGWLVTWTSSGPKGDSVDVYQKVFHYYKDKTLIGTKRSDKLVTASGDDTLKGKAGGDVLVGRDGNDALFGQNGSDTLNGGKGKDTLTGGKGKDKFLFHKKDGTDKIVDFKNGQDKLVLKGFGFKSKKAALKHFYEIGGAHDDKVGFNYKGTKIIIKGADLSDITNDDVLI